MIAFHSVRMQLREASFTPGPLANLTQHDIFVISAPQLPVAKPAGSVYL